MFPFDIWLNFIFLKMGNNPTLLKLYKNQYKPGSAVLV